MPRVLIIGIEPFNRTNGSGITLSNIFEGWAKDSLAQIYMSSHIPLQDICNRYFYLEPKTAFFDYYFRLLFRKSNKSKNEGLDIPATIPLNDENKNFKNKIHINLRALLDIGPLVLTRSLFEWIKEFNPDLIYSTLGTNRIIKLTNLIAGSLNKPIVPHFMDDWPSLLFTQNELGGIARKSFEKNFKKMLRKSNGGLCISNLMSSEYHNRYKLPFITMGNCVDKSAFKKPDFSDSPDIFKVMYVGGLHLNRWKSILDIAMAIEQLNNMERKIQLYVYCPTKDIESYSSHFHNLKYTIFGGSIKSEEVLSVLKDAYMVIHTESFENNFIKYTQYSLSTKIPQYMAAGKPILAYGPKYLASIQHIIEANAGLVVSNQAIEDLVNKINQILMNRDLLMELATNGFAYAKKHHSKEANHILLKSTLLKYTK